MEMMNMPESHAEVVDADAGRAAESSVLQTDGHEPLQPLDDVDRLSEDNAKKNRAKVGSARPSSLLYTFGPGSVMDLPEFTIMPGGFDDWDRIWNRRDTIPQIRAPRLLDAVRTMLKSDVDQLRPFPHQAKRQSFSDEGRDLGVPARVFPQWFRCTGCDKLGLLPQFSYSNTHPYRTDEARFEHSPCHGRSGEQRTKRRSPAVPARYLVVCVNGHVEEFPYDWWVHHGGSCPKAETPALRMIQREVGRGASARIVCDSCGERRRMNEAQGETGRAKLPKCRGRHPHLGGFQPGGCGLETRLMMVGASNLWFPVTQSVIVMPETKTEHDRELADRLRRTVGDQLADYTAVPHLLRGAYGRQFPELADRSDAEVVALINAAMNPPVAQDLEEKHRKWDPIDLLVPEWRYLLSPPLGPSHEDQHNDFRMTERARADQLRGEITKVLAIEKLRKVNALLGFTRVDAIDRVEDLAGRLAPLTIDNPKGVVATQDYGEGVFLQLDEDRVAAWEQQIESSDLWQAHREAHRRNFANRFSETADPNTDPDDRLPPPRYWLVHTLAHILIREMAMDCGYAAASLSERLYAWAGTETRPPAAGLLICTTASGSDGTLGGLVRLSEPDRLAGIVDHALQRARRCSSDPVCATRTPKDPEDYLHGAACHCCAMASETSCERSNRFLDRRFLVDLPDSRLGFFDAGHAR
jgi:hypothetical protein